MVRRILQILLREKSEIGQFDDESLHGLEITKGVYRGEGKGSVAQESLGIVARIMRATILGDVGHRAFHNEPSGQRSVSMQALAYFCSDSFKV